MNALMLAHKLSKMSGVVGMVAGGSVRDLLYDARPKDFDVVAFSKASFDAILKHLTTTFNLQVMHDMQDPSCEHGNGEDDMFTDRWTDWVQLQGSFTVDLLLPKMFPRSCVSPGHFRQEYAIAYRVLDSFDCSMNQNALIMFGGDVHPYFMGTDDKCYELRKLHTERRERMRLKAAVYNLEWVPYDPTRSVA